MRSMQPRRPAQVGKIEKAHDPRQAMLRLALYLQPLLGRDALCACAGGRLYAARAARPLLDGRGDRPVYQRQRPGRAAVHFAPSCSSCTYPQQPVPGRRQLGDDHRLAAFAPAAAAGPVHPPAAAAAALLRQQSGGRADEPPDQRYRRHQPGGVTERDLAGRQRAVARRHHHRDVLAQPLPGAGHAAGRADHAVVYRVCRQVHAQGLPWSAEKPGRDECHHGGVDQRAEGDQGLWPQRLGGRVLPCGQPGGVRGRRLCQHLCSAADAAHECVGQLLRHRAGDAGRLPGAAGHRHGWRHCHLCHVRAEFYPAAAPAGQHVQRDPGRAGRVGACL